MADGLSYEDFFTQEEVAVFRMVKRGQMMLASIVREELAELVGGTVGSGKEFLSTERGLFRIALRANSDNKTERRAHDRMGVETVNVGDPVELELFLLRHDRAGWNADHLMRRVGLRMRERAELLEQNWTLHGDPDGPFPASEPKATVKTKPGETTVTVDFRGRP